MPDRELVDDADRLILHEAQPLGAAAAVAILAQALFGHGAACPERGLEALGDRRAQLALAPAMDVGQGGEIRRHGGGIEQAGLVRLEFGNLVHDYPIAEAGSRVTAAPVRRKTLALARRPSGEGSSTKSPRAIRPFPCLLLGVLLTRYAQCE
jgi:hypothetical protein